MTAGIQGGAAVDLVDSPAMLPLLADVDLEKKEQELSATFEEHQASWVAGFQTIGAHLPSTMKERCNNDRGWSQWL